MIKSTFYILSFLIIFVNNLYASKDIKIIAKVNNQIITNIDINEHYKLTKFLSKIDIESKSQKKIIFNKLLQQIIEEKLRLTDIKKQNITTNTEIESEINQIITNYHGDLVTLKKRMKDMNISYKNYRDQIKTKILFSKVVQKNISPAIKATNSDINEILEINNIKNTIKSFKILEIYIAKSDNSQKIAKILFSELKDNSNFKKLSKEFSNLYDHVSAEDATWIKEGELNPKLYQSISNLDIGQISNPTEINESYYIFKIIDKKDIPNVNINNLRQIEDMIFKKKLSISIKSYMSDLRKNSNIVIF
ncbi:MAG: peptidyl-prolyl cis-trans isomerase SurA [Rickettsiales bacterium]|jgi:peptidyl-prolyl cis-trans isomerase SurA